MTFYSTIGKKRFKNIWTEQNLDQENIFSSWIGVGPSSTLINEKVSDYMQNYLIAKNKTIQSLNNALTTRLHITGNYDEFFESVGRKEKHYTFQDIAGAYQAVYNQIMDNRLNTRRQIEKDRIKTLIINKKMNAPPGFKNPILNLNTIGEELSALEALQQRASQRDSFGGLPTIKKVKESKILPLKLRDNFSKGVPQNFDYDESGDDNFLTIANTTADGGNPRDLRRISKDFAESLVEFSQHNEAAEKSVDPKTEIEITSLPQNSQIKIRILSDDNLFFNDPELEELSGMWELDEDRSRSYTTDIEDIEIFTEAEIFDFYGATGDVEWTMDFPVMSPLVETVIDEENVRTMFKTAHETIRAFRRQFATVKDEILILNRLFPY